tara:strand:- start:187 stop:360 length:174 start_codon:yes stop_codon:yes gene_type:complete
MVDMMKFALFVFDRIAEDNDSLVEWCVLIRFRSTLFDNLRIRLLILKKITQQLPHAR